MSRNDQNRRSNHRRKLYELQKGKCFYCECNMKLIIGQYSTEDNIITLDRKVPEMEGGTYCFDNLIGACQKCNNLRGSIPFEIFKEEKLYLDKNKQRRVELLLFYNSKSNYRRMEWIKHRLESRKMVLNEC